MKVINNELYLEISELETLGIERKTIYNGIALNKKGVSNNWHHIKLAGQKGVFIDYEFIPVTSLKKLPTKTELLQTFLDQKNKELALLNAVKSLQEA